MFNSCLIKFKTFDNKYGELVPIEGLKDIPFEIKRVYYITNVDEGIVRGHHAHRKLHQVVICIKGSCTMKLDNGNSEEEINLCRNNVGLYIGPYIWREMYNFSEDCVLLVLASDYYTEEDYIRNYDFYLKEVEGRF